MTPPEFQPSTYNRSLTSVMTAVMKQVYLLMTLGLAITGILAWACANSPSYMHFMLTNTWFMWVLLLGTIGIVIYFTARLSRMTGPTAVCIFLFFSALQALWLAPIFLIYTGATLAKTFFITAGMFAAMSIYGYTTGRDLSRMGSLLTMALIGLIIMIFVNMFTRSAAFDYIISIIGVLLFVGLTAWDTQQIKQMALTASVPDGRLAAIGALSLYLDFINLFLFLLRLFGGRD